MRSIIGTKLASLYELSKQNNILASLHKLTKQNTIRRVAFLRDCKKVTIRILFQKVSLGWKLSPVINRRGGGRRDWNKNVLGWKKIEKLISGGMSSRHPRVFHFDTQLFNLWEYSIGRFI